jgi:predicted HTH domain antitoxin
METEDVKLPSELLKVANLEQGNLSQEAARLLALELYREDRVSVGRAAETGAKILGHSTIEMTADIYTHISAEVEREAAVALERALYGDMFPVVPNFANRNNSAALN